jgi:peptidyl-prolyl cis-trans isomerase B (cyclophilin B)
MRRLVLLAVLSFAAGCLDAPETGNAPPTPPLDDSPVTFEALHFVTDAGDITAILFPEETPATAEFIKKLVTSGYYDGREFNRVIPGFVVQEVDRAGGATDQTETVALEGETSVYFSAGAFGIARNEDPDSGGSEFFIMDFAHSHLYRNYTAFAQVIEGLDVVHAIARVQTIATGPASSPPVSPPVAPPVGVHDRIAIQPVKITKATVTEVTLPAAIARHYPLVVGERTVVETTRYTPEWPADLRAGAASELTWYVYTPADDPPPALGDAKAHVTGPTVDADYPLTPDVADGRILHWTWTPTMPGEHNVSLRIGGKDVAVNVVTVA